MGEEPKDVVEMIEGLGGTVESVTILPDGSGAMTASMPLAEDHWLYADDGSYEAPPMPFRMGKSDPRHREFVDAIWAAAKHAVRAATMKGKEDDFDPDALCQNMVVGLIGYHTPDGLSSTDDWSNPDPIPPRFPKFYIEET